MRGTSREVGVEPLRIVACHVEPEAYRLVTGWAWERGHEIPLVVTTPGPPPRTYHGYREIVAEAPAGQDVLVTTRLKRAVPLIAALAPDLLLSYTFPSRIPAELRAVPRLGAVNLHPTPLPRFRGPNPARMVYEAEPTIGATLHRTEEGWDTGAILGRAEGPVPAVPTVEALHAAWRELLVAALDEGIGRVVVGDRGEPQDDARASYAAAFSAEEHWLDWSWPAATLQRRAAALNLLVPRALALIDGVPVRVVDVRPLGHRQPPAGLAGTIEGEGGSRRIAVADGLVEVRWQRIAPEEAAAGAMPVGEPPGAVAAD